MLPTASPPASFWLTPSSPRPSFPLSLSSPWQPSDILLFSRKMLSTTVFPPNFEFTRRMSHVMMRPEGEGGAPPSETTAAATAAAAAATTERSSSGGSRNAAKKAILALISASGVGGPQVS